MAKRVILVTGTPAVGKTTMAKALAEKLKAKYVNLSDYAKTEKLIVEEDRARDTEVIDETKMRRKLTALTAHTSGDVVIDGHYAAAVVPKQLVSAVFVLRRNPVQLQELMQKRGYSQAKQKENLEAEILDVCLVEAVKKQEKDCICELDVTGKEVEDTLSEIVAVLEGRKRCYFGCIDWMSMLEREGKLGEFLKP